MYFVGLPTLSPRKNKLAGSFSCYPIIINLNTMYNNGFNTTVKKIYACIQIKARTPRVVIWYQMNERTHFCAESKGKKKIHFLMELFHFRGLEEEKWPSFLIQATFTVVSSNNFSVAVSAYSLPLPFKSPMLP